MQCERGQLRALELMKALHAIAPIKRLGGARHRLDREAGAVHVRSPTAAPSGPLGWTGLFLSGSCKAAQSSLKTEREQE